MIKTVSFKGGIHPPQFKELTRHCKIRPARLPKKVIIPLIQHTGAPAQLLVNTGDFVYTGTKLAEGVKFISASAHSSISGKVTKIENFNHPILNRCKAVEIESDDKDLPEPSMKPLPFPDNPSFDDILNIISNSGIVGLGGAAFPTHAKLGISKEKRIGTLIINAAECEPYLTCDFRIIVEHAKELLKGVYLIKNILGVNECIIAIEDNKPEAVVAINNIINEPKNEKYREKIGLIKLKTKYPQGGEKQLIEAVLEKEVPSGGLPLDIGVVVLNVATCFAIYEAVYLGKPLYERVITITGDIVSNPGNYRVRIGALAWDLMEEVGLKETPSKVIFGGPMMGWAQADLATPVIKGTTGIVVFGKNELIKEKRTACIKCGKCIDVCPVGLNPTRLARLSEKELWDRLNEFYVKDCIECGCCSYACPAKIPLAQLIKTGKLKVAKT